MNQTFAEWGPEFEIIFDFKVIKEIPKDHWYNLIHLWATGNNGKRLPGVWFRTKQHDPRPFMRVQFSKQANEGADYYDKSLEMDKWYSVHLDNKVVDGSGMFTVTLDGEEVWTLNGSNNKGPMASHVENVESYQSDPWSPESAGDHVQVRCLQVINKNYGTTV